MTTTASVTSDTASSVQVTITPATVQSTPQPEVGTFSQRDLPWMKVGTVIDRPVSMQEALEMAGLNFEVATMAAGWRRADGKSWKRTQDRFAIIRTDTEEFFNFCSSDYRPVQYREAFEFAESINPEIVAAGQLKGGRQGFVVTQLPDRKKITLNLNGVEDDHDLYVLLRTSQDLSRGVEVALVTLRHRCMNQLTLPSLTKDAPQLWAIRHTQNVKERLEQARNILTTADTYVEAFEKNAARLVKLSVTPEMAEMMLKNTLPNRPRTEATIEAILDSFRTSDTVGDAFFGTGWGLLQATEGYFEHGRSPRGRTDESRFTDGLDGAAHRYADKLMRLLITRAPR